MKRCIYTIMPFFLIMACLTCGSVAYASEESIGDDFAEQYQITPRYTNLMSASASIEIKESTGRVACGMNAVSRGTTDTLKVTLALQMLSGNTWSNVKTWTTSGENTISMMKYYYISQAGTYRVQSVTEVYDSDGNYIESATATSTSKSYS